MNEYIYINIHINVTICFKVLTKHDEYIVRTFVYLLSRNMSDRYGGGKSGCLVNTIKGGRNPNYKFHGKGDRWRRNRMSWNHTRTTDYTEQIYR